MDGVEGGEGAGVGASSGEPEQATSETTSASELMAADIFSERVVIVEVSVITAGPSAMCDVLSPAMWWVKRVIS